jgi:hypothetical protein
VHVDMLISCESGQCFGIVENSKSKAFMNGNTTLAWMNLVEKFESNTKVNTALFKKEFMECKSEGASKDPDEWLLKLKSLR